MNRFLKLFAFPAALAITIGLAGQVLGGQIAYITGASDPWGDTTNDSAMDVAFGPANWDKTTFGNAFPSGVFSPGNYLFVYIDGGDGQDTGFYNFINTNKPALESWVAAGGSLFLNSAGWTTITLDVGFGAQLNSEMVGNSTCSYTATALTSHPIFDAGTGTNWTGNYFSHDTVTGTGLTDLIGGTAGVVLAEKDWGLGHVMIGGMTTANFHSPQPEAFNLRVNEFAYGLSQAVPEPSTFVLLGVGVLGLLACARRRK